MGGERFADGTAAWLSRMGRLRNVVRQEMVRRQLESAVPGNRGWALDVGAGQGTQAIALARRGWQVDATEPSAEMRAVLQDQLDQEPPRVAARVRILDTDLDDLARLTGSYDLVLCHGVLMYLDSPEAAVAALAERVGPGGAVSIVARNGPAMAWRPALRGDWEGVSQMLREIGAATQESRDLQYRNEIGVEARADNVDHIIDLLAENGLADAEWFGVRIATDGVDVETPLPIDPDELARLLDAEEALGRVDPYRRLATLFHVVARRADESD